MRQRLFDIIEKDKYDDPLSLSYDIFMIAVINISLVPLAFKQSGTFFGIIESFCAIVFIIDYILRLITADFKVKKGILSFFIYPLMPLAVIDLICIIPSISMLSQGYKLLKLIRLIRTLRVLKVLRYSRAIKMIKRVFIAQKEPLITVGMLAISYILISALIIFNVEPDSFDSYFEAIYWATVSLTTMGYGDISPVTTIGRLVTIVSSFFGIAIIALPSGIITAGFLKELNVDEYSPAKNNMQIPKSDEESDIKKTSV